MLINIQKSREKTLSNNIELNYVEEMFFNLKILKRKPDNYIISRCF